MATTALITGASGGIGLEFARLLAQHGHTLALIARDEGVLHHAAGQLRERSHVTVHVLAHDLSRPAAVEELAAQLRAQAISVDILVNNAGSGLFGPFAENDLGDVTRMMHVNMTALTQLTRLLLPAMLARRQGRILNVASTAAFQPGPLMAVYYATKAYVLSFSEALANELSGSGVTVTALCPGLTRTNFQQRAKMERSKLFTGVVMDAATVARIGYRGMMQGRRVVVPGWRNQLLATMVRFAPRRMVTAMVRRVQESR